MYKFWRKYRSLYIFLERRLNQHNRMKHRLYRLDGKDDTTEFTEKVSLLIEKMSLKTLPAQSSQWTVASAIVVLVMNVNTFWQKKDWFSRHIMNAHDPPNVLKHFGKAMVRKHMYLTNKHYNYANDRYRCNMWDSLMASSKGRSFQVLEERVILAFLVVYIYYFLHMWTEGMAKYKPMLIIVWSNFQTTELSKSNLILISCNIFQWFVVCLVLAS